MTTLATGGGGGYETHLALLADVGELTSMLAGSTDVRGFLQRTVEMVAQHLVAGVCSIYLYEEEEEALVLTATVGLHPRSVGLVRLRRGEGLVGKALAEERPVEVSGASRSPDYKYFPGTDEERFENFLAVPILRGVEKIGVMVVQREGDRAFTAAETVVLRVLTSQLAGAVENARALLSAAAVPGGARVPDGGSTFRGIVRGKAIAPGIVHAPARVFGMRTLEEGVERAGLTVGEPAVALAVAVQAAAEQLEAMQRQLDERLPESASLVFDAHIMMLKERGFSGRMLEAVRGGASPAGAVMEVARHFMRIFEASTHDYMREKAKDVEDVALRILSNLAGEGTPSAGRFAGRIVIARDLLPSDILTVAGENVAGVVLTGGGVTAHVSLLVRSLQVPTVIAREPELLRLADGTDLLLDGDVGNLYVVPEAQTLARFLEHAHNRKDALAQAEGMRAETRTRDGVRVRLLANINLLSELALARELKAEGVGLYRSEVPFLVRSTLPTEEEQEAVYRAVFARMAGGEVVMRTLDAGGDKLLGYFDHAGEANPALGLRSMRFTLQHGEVLDQQLRAMLRAADGFGPLRVLFPMIGSLDELRAARGHLAGCVEAVGRELGRPLEAPQVGMMIEVPSVIETMADFAAEVDFFSIGTNDFVQYMLAADRTNERVASFYCEHHPAVLRALARMVRCAVAAGREMTICGEMAHDERFLPFFLGVGIRKLSVDPRFLPRVQAALAGWTLAEAQSLTERLLAEPTLAGVERVLAGVAGAAGQPKRPVT